MEFKIVAVHFFQNHLNCVALSVKSFVDINRKIKPWKKKTKKKNREGKQKLLCCVVRGDEKFTGPTTDASWNRGSVTSHKMKLLIIPFPPKKVRNMVRIKLTSDLSLGDLCALRENSARDTQNIVKHYEKGIYLSPGIWIREYTYHTRKINGFCDYPLDEFIKPTPISLHWELSVELME